jgi:hypothetical protein
MDFFKECMNLKKPVLKFSFTSLLSDFLIEDLVTLGNLLSIEFMKPQRRFFATPRWQA